LKLWVRFQLCRPRCSLSIWGCAGGLVLWESTVRSEIVLMLPFCKFTDRRSVISELVECAKLLLNTVVDDHPSLTAPSLKSPFLPPGWLQTILFFSHEDQTRSWFVSTLTYPHWAWKYIAYPALALSHVCGDSKSSVSQIRIALRGLGRTTKDGTTPARHRYVIAARSLQSFARSCSRCC
jgi:hypothetical protein